MCDNKFISIETVKGLLGYIFDVMNKHMIIAVLDIRNTNSAKLLERAGMRRAGHFIKNAWYRGEYTDEYLYAMLRVEWTMGGKK